MNVISRIAPFTFDDFCLLVPDGQKGDLIDGVIYMASPENVEANLLFVWLISLLDSYVEARDLGKIFGFRAAFRLNNRNGPEPDIAFVRKDRLHLARRGHFAGRPDLAMEIVSPESIDRDYEKKRLQYQNAGVLEYWIVDEMEQKVTLLRLAANGKYREVRPTKGILRSKVIAGFALRPEWLWQQPRPKKAEILAKLLEGSV
jgi:Uma2 family endonuclease